MSHFDFPRTALSFNARFAISPSYKLAPSRHHHWQAPSIMGLSERFITFFERQFTGLVKLLNISAVAREAD